MIQLSRIGRGPVLRAVAMWVLALTLTSGVRGQVVVDSKGFESPFYSTTQLAGQAASPSGTWQKFAVGNTNTATVQSAIVAPGGGTQAVRINRGAGGNDLWGVVVGGQPAGQFLNMQWDMRVENAGGTFGPYFSAQAYSGSALLGAFGVDASTGDILYQAQTTGFLTETGPTVAFGAWNHFAIELNFSTHRYKGFVNGAQLVDSGFVDGPINTFTDGDIAAQAAAGDAASAALTGTGYFDNFIINSGPIPEPATLSALIAALVLSVTPRATHRRLVSGSEPLLASR